MTPLLTKIAAIDKALKAEFKAHSAPIIELIEAQTHDPFCVLVGTILSARTKDACTAGAVKRLFGTATAHFTEMRPRDAATAHFTEMRPRDGTATAHFTEMRPRDAVTAHFTEMRPRDGTATAHFTEMRPRDAAKAHFAEMRPRDAATAHFAEMRPRDTDRTPSGRARAPREPQGNNGRAGRPGQPHGNNAPVFTPEDLERLSLAELEKLIYPVGFYHDKARHLKALPKVLKEKFNGVLPNTVEELCELPGVGRKTANLTVAVGFDLPAICVDVHVHRISNRLNLVKTKTPLETEMALRKLLPVKYWKTWNSHLVSFGQTRCGPLHPKCEGCPIAKYCSDCRCAGKQRRRDIPVA